MTPSEEALVEAGGVVEVSIDGNIHQYGRGSLDGVPLMWSWEWVGVVPTGKWWPGVESPDVPTTADEWRDLAARGGR